ncbi:hypothetical protein [Nonomuraea sp. NPDC050540]|uniref:hypothetical protein n=1 Tax=Nonomuraea sp. NPDC050540 TaxID=3364367 RepID=UPI00378DF429
MWWIMAFVDFAGVFDIHLTVAPGDDVERLDAWAAGNQATLTHVVLARGAVTCQPTLTLAGRGTLPEQRAAAATCAAGLREAGFRVVRVKIEAAPWNRDVPWTAAAAAKLDGCYFEHHVTVIDPARTEQLAEIAQRHSAHLSRNARRVRPDGSAERYVTQRCRGVGLSVAGHRLDALVRALGADGFAVLESEREFVVHDDNPGIDRGWIEEAQPRADR